MKRVLALALLLALSACTKIVEINGHRVDNKVSAQDHVEIASKYFQMGDYDHAQFHVQRAIDLDPDSAAAYSLQGVLLERQGDIKGARDNYAKAVSVDGKYAPGRNNYGAFLFRQGDYKEAIEQLQVPADDINYEQRDQALANLGRAAEKVGDNQLAEDSFTRALRLHPEMPDATLELAEIKFDSGDTDLAHHLYQHYLEIVQGQALQSARSLWLGIRLERIYGDRNALSSYELALVHLYPESSEYQAYLKSKPPESNGSE